MNGIDKGIHLDYLKYTNKLKHFEMKEKILCNHFPTKGQDASNYVLFVFISRICEMKGLMVFIDSIELLLRERHSSCLFFIRGKMDGSEYSLRCERKLAQLWKEFPDNINYDISRFIHNK